MQLLTVRDKNGLIVTNEEQTVFLFVDKHHLQVCPGLHNKIVQKYFFVMYVSEYN